MPINSGAGGADESTVTTSSSAGGGTAWNTVTIGTAATLVHDTDDLNTSTTWYRFATGASSVQANVLWSSAVITPAQTRYYGGCWYRQTGTPGSTTITLMRGRATSTQSMRVTATSGALQIRNTSNTVVATSTVTLATNVRYFVRWDVTVGTTTTGAATVELYDENGTLLDTLTTTGQNYGTVAVNEITFGIVTNTINHPAFQLRGFTSSATEWPPPPGQVAQVNVARAGTGLKTLAAGRAVETSTARAGSGQPVRPLNSGNGIAGRNGTASHTIGFGFTSATNNLLVFIVYGSVTHTATGWAKQLAPVTSGELAVFTKTSAGESSITVTHNGSDYPVLWQAYEFPAGSVYTAGYAENTTSSDTWPGLSGLPGSIPQFVIAARGRSSGAPVDNTASTVWDAPWVEDCDLVVADDGVTDGGYLTVGHRNDYTGTSVTPSATTTYAWGTTDRQHAVFAIQARVAGVVTDFTGTNGDPWPVPWSTVSGTNVIASNRGQQTTPTGTYNASESRANMLGTDIRVDATVRFSQSGNVSQRINLRWDPNTGNGYRLILPTDYAGMQIMKVTAYSETPIVEEFTTVWAASTDYRVAFEVVGTTVRAKRWLAGDPDPGSWLISGTDATYASGDVSLVTVNGASGGAVTGAWDDVTAAPSVADGTLAAGRATETSTARAGTGLRTAAAVRAVETDLGRAGAGLRSTTAGRATESSVGRAAAGLRTAAAGRAVETDLGRPGTGLRTATAGRGTETDVGRSGTGLRTAAAVRAVETSVGRAGAGAKTGVAGRASEVDTAVPGGSGLTLSAGRAVETSVGRAGTGLRTAAAGRATESSVGRPAAGGAKTSGTAGRATETDVGRPGTGLRSIAAGRATVVEVSRAGTGVKTGAPGRASEVDVARAGASSSAGTAGRADETDVARPGALLVSGAAGRAAETDLAAAGTGLRTCIAGRAVETSTARSPLHIRPVRSSRAGVRVGSTTGGVRFL